MQVFVDDNQVEEALVGSGTIEDALRRVQSHLSKPDRLVIGVRCDGRDVPPDAMAATMQQPTSSVERLEVFTGTRGALVTDAMAQASTCLAETEEACRRSAELFTEGETVEAAETLGECLRVWQQIHEAVGKSIEMLQLDPEQATVNEQSLIEVISKPKEILLQIKEALQDRDHVLLADLLQYEFPEVTSQWHAVVASLQQQAENLHAGHSP